MRFDRDQFLVALPLWAVCALGASGWAQTASQPDAGQISPAYTSCLSRAGSNTVQRGICAQAELSRQDDRLNRAYQALRTAYTGTGASSASAETDAQRRLREEERAWLADRDQVCKLNHDTVDNGCLIARESARADELEARLRQQP